MKKILLFFLIIISTSYSHAQSYSKGSLVFNLNTTKSVFVRTVGLYELVENQSQCHLKQEYIYGRERLLSDSISISIERNTVIKLGKKPKSKKKNIDCDYVLTQFALIFRSEKDGRAFGGEYNITGDFKSTNDGRNTFQFFTLKHPEEGKTYWDEGEIRFQGEPSILFDSSYTADIDLEYLGYGY